MLVLKFVHLLTVFKFVQRFCYLLSATSSQLIGLMVSKKHKISRNGCSPKSKFITCNCIVFFLGDHKPYEGSHARGREALVYEITEMRTGPNRSLKTSKMAAMKSNAPHE